MAVATVQNCGNLLNSVTKVVAILIVACAAAVPLLVRAEELPRVASEQEGLSSARLSYIDQIYTDKVKRGEMAGIVTLIARHGKIAHFSAIDYADIERKREMETDTIFRLYSMTKPIASVALMTLYQEGRFRLTDPLSKFILELADLRVLRDPKGPLDETMAVVHTPTVQDALRHTVGFTHGLETDAYDNLYTKADLFGLDVSLEEMMSRLAPISPRGLSK